MSLRLSDVINEIFENKHPLMFFGGHQIDLVAPACNQRFIQTCFILNCTKVCEDYMTVRRLPESSDDCIAYH